MVIEGLLWAAAPQLGLRLLAGRGQTPEQTLRTAGAAAIAAGVRARLAGARAEAASVPARPVSPLDFGMEASA